jgi:hypothetical protein
MMRRQAKLSPRLSTIQPAVVLDNIRVAIDAAAVRAGRLTTTPTRQATLQPVIAEVVTFAINGEGDVDRVDAALDDLMAFLFTSPGDAFSKTTSATPAFNIETSLGLVLAAASARLKLARKEPLTTGELAALSGYSAQRVRQMAQDGSLRRVARVQRGRKMDAPIRWADAKDFLDRAAA